MTKETLENIIKRTNYDFVHSSLTTANFPIPDTIETENWKLIEIPKGEYWSSEKCLEEIKKKGYRPANAYELALWSEKHRQDMPKGTLYVGLGQSWYDDGFHRVPYVFAFSDGDFKFILVYFERAWYGGSCLLCFCDVQSLDTSTRGKETDSLTLENAIKIVKEAGYTIIKEI